MKKIGNWWNDKNINIYKINGRNIALYGWNGEKYTECFEVSKNLLDIIKNNIEAIPVYAPFQKNDEFIIDYYIIIDN